MNNKKGLLPIVKEGIGDAIEAEVRQVGIDNYLINVLERL